MRVRRYRGLAYHGASAISVFPLVRFKRGEVYHNYKSSLFCAPSYLPTLMLREKEDTIYMISRTGIGTSIPFTILNSP